MNEPSWVVLSRLLDDALELPPCDRATWVESLGPEFDEFKPRLRAMLVPATPASDDFLATLPKLNPSDSDSSQEHRVGTKQPGATVGAYRLVRQLAAGGQASVWLADRTDQLVNRPVAVKLPHVLGHRSDLGERMAREREILATLNHSHIARLYDAGVTPEGDPFLALEYVEGTTIDEHCRERGLTITDRLHVFLQVLHAVAYAHAQLVIHRDLKPSNVLVTADGSVRLLDFGIARLINVDPDLDSTLTAVGGRAMTLAYASPEQVARQPLGVATDVYSLGVMLDELAFGDSSDEPARESAAALEEAILETEPVRPAKPRPTGCCARGCAVTSTNRAQGAEEGTGGSLCHRRMRLPKTSNASCKDDLCRRARPAGSYRARKFAGRNRIAVSAAAVVCLAVVAGAGVATWQARLARAEQARAEAVKDFIASIFRDVDPNLRGEARPLTAVEVLSLARDRLETQLTTAPDVRFELRRILGDSLVAVGDPAKAADVLTRALAEASSVHDDETTLIETELLLAEAKRYLAKTAEADQHLDRVLAALERTGRLQTEEFVKAKMLRAQILVTSGRAATPDAEAASREALDAATRILGPSHEMRAAALGDLSAVYRTHSKHDLALANAEEAYRVLYRGARTLVTRPESHPRTERVWARAVSGGSDREGGRADERGGGQCGRRPPRRPHDSPASARDTGQRAIGLRRNRGSPRQLRAGRGDGSAGVQLSDTYRASQDGVKARISLAARRPAEALPFYERPSRGTARAPTPRTFSCSKLNTARRWGGWAGP